MLCHKKILLSGAKRPVMASRINEIPMVDYSPEKAGVGGSTPSRGTMFSGT